ncbi:acyl carrier protein [Nannocystis pusilla]|uniref:acyl carrier protein n=1 Tax=Nannocystis pusilla TaxID=889268 RepID=UPI003B7DE3C5
MTRAEIYNRIVGILVKSFELDPNDIRPESRLFEDLDLDSIDAIDMFVELHEVTGRRIDVQVARKIRTVEDIVKLVESELASANVPRPRSDGPVAFPPLDEILPHRPPMLLLDALTAAEAESVTCRATVRAGAPFVASERVSSLIALEYFAQAVAALFAYKSRGGAGPFRGLLLGARDLELAVSHLRVGDVLDVHCREQWASGPVAQFQCILSRGDERLATGAVTVLRGDPAEFAAASPAAGPAATCPPGHPAATCPPGHPAALPRRPRRP